MNTTKNSVSTNFSIFKEGLEPIVSILKMLFYILQEPKIL
jgi:hypothetical protein